MLFARLALSMLTGALYLLKPTLCVRKLSLRPAGALRKCRHRLLSTIDDSSNQVMEQFTSTIARWEEWEYGSFPLRAKGPGGDLMTKVINKQTTQNQPLEPPRSYPTEALWTTLSDSQVQACIQELSRFSTAERLQRFESVLSQRTLQSRFVFENPTNPNNIWAALRTLDSFGVQCADVVLNDDVHCDAFRSSSVRAALGSQQWLSLAQHNDTAACLSMLKDSGHRIVCLDLQPESRPLDAVDFSALRDSRIAWVVGSEEGGISASARAMCDWSLTLPQRGFAQSLNLSAAVAALCAALHVHGLLAPSMSSSSSTTSTSSRDQPQRDRVLLMWLLRSVRGGRGILAKAGLAP